MIVLVVPTNRPAAVQAFLDAWHKHRADWDAVVLVEDNERRTFTAHCHGRYYEHFSHHEIAADLGDDAWIISKQDSACRCYGFLKAKQLGAKWIFTLDDDCFPIDDTPICQAHFKAMQHTVWQPTAGTRTRGLPYRHLGHVSSRLNMGLWRGNADLDGPQGLAASAAPFVPPAGNQLANPRHRYPLCGMNLFFDVALLPALYFPLMGAGQPYRRFDDIWAGLVFQRVAEHCGTPWSFGTPWVEHIRASDPFANLVREAPGIVANEMMWEKVNAVGLSDAARDEVGAAVGELAVGLQSDTDPYVASWGRALETWNRLASV